eukprot:TRINITY_DN40443_c0_g1_i1.p1 TRINITY_DN40443_c0_g1~~TRINITY_DN40443_c0_g1_i1.p1  ORF type:complete len:342 (-),score=26.50 TRINITY_DN40443_c0_g1_i1:160-1185(-)
MSCGNVAFSACRLHRVVSSHSFPRAPIARCWTRSSAVTCCLARSIRHTTSGASAANAESQNIATKALVAGTLAGSAGSLVGMGGGFLAIPIMTSGLMAFSQHQANATSLMTVLATGAAGGASFALVGSVDWGAAAAIAGGGIVTANLGAKLAARFPGYALKGLMGLFMLCVGPGILLKPRLLEALNEPRSDANTNASATTSRRSRGIENSFGHIMKLVAIGGAVGIFCGIFGVGGGAVTVPAVSFCLPELSHQDALGTSLAAMVLPAISGLARHAQTGAIVWRAAFPLAAGSSMGSFLTGRYVALELDESTLRGIFAATMVIMGGRTFQGALRARQAALSR